MVIGEAVVVGCSCCRAAASTRYAKTRQSRSLWERQRTVPSAGEAIYWEAGVLLALFDYESALGGAGAADFMHGGTTDYLREVKRKENA